jgi:hypothetical protein
VDSAYIGLRDPFLKSISKNKSVLHVGCTDFPFAEVSMNNDTLLHKKLLDETTMLVGIDIDKSGLAYLEKELPGLYLCGDLCNPDVREKLFQYEIDLILVPDVIEHVPNQNTFIEGLLALASSLQAELIITTPHQSSFKAMLAVLAGLDFTHTDHRLIHNVTTLRTAIVHDFNLSDTNFQVDYASRDIKARYGNFMSVVSRIFDKLFFVTPYLADTIVVTVKSQIK